MKKILLAIIILFSVLSCSNNISDRIELKIWLDAPDKEMEFLKKTAKLFEEENPKVKISFRLIQFNKLKPTFIGQLKSNKEPDIIFLVNDWIGELAEKKLILPLDSDYVGFIHKIIKGLKYKDRLYAMPRTFDVVAILYNKELVPRPPRNVGEMINIANKLSQRRLYGLMYDNKNFYYHFPWFYGFGGRIFDRQGNFLPPDSNAVKSFEFAVGLEKDKKIIPQKSNYSAMINMFSSGQAGMIITGPWALDEIEKNNIRYGVAPLPLLPDGNHPAPLMGIKGCAVTSFSRYPDIAKKAVEFFTSEKIQRLAVNELKMMPCIKSIYKEKISDQMKGFYEQSKYAVPMPTSPKIKYVWQEYNWALGMAFENRKDIKKYLDQASAKIKKNINQEKL